MSAEKKVSVPWSESMNGIRSNERCSSAMKIVGNLLVFLNLCGGILPRLNSRSLKFRRELLKPLREI
jgi:hypothetical protein